MEGMKAPIVAAGGGATPRDLMELAVGSANGDASAMEKLGAIFAQAQ